VAVRLGNLTTLVPATWRVRHVRERCGQFGAGVLVGDLTLRQLRSIHHPAFPGGCTTRWDLSGLGAKYAVVSLDIGPFPVPVPVSRFPLNPRKFGVATDGTCRCSVRFHELAVGPTTYLLRAWLGVDASAMERKEFNEVLRSIAPIHRR